MEEEPVSVQHVAARRLAVAAAATPRRELSTTIRRLLDQVWPVLRAQHVTTGHNVVVYLAAASGLLQIEAGVEISGEFVPTEVVYESATPAGLVATAAHVGPYDQMHRAYAPLDAWAQAHLELPVQLRWEVYGDWSDDPSQLRTDVYYKLPER